MRDDGGSLKTRGPAELLAAWMRSGGPLLDAAALEGGSAAACVVEALDALPEAVIILGRTGQVLWASAGARQVLGWDPRELTGQPISVVALEDDVDHQQRMLDDIHRTSRTTSFTATRRRRDGSAVQVAVSMAPLHDPGTGEVVGTCATVRNAAPQVHLQTELAHQQSLTATLSRRSSDVALIAKPDTEITYISPSVLDVLGFRPEDVVGSKGLGFVHEDDLEEVTAFVGRVLTTPGSVERKTFRIRNGRDEWRWIEETLTNCVDVPSVAGLVANIRDVTSEIEARAALTASERRYRTIVETAQEGVLVVDRETRILFANRKAAQILGHARSHMYRQRLADFVDPTAAAEMHRRVASRAHVGPERYEVDYPHPDGRTRTFEIAASPIALDAEGDMGSLAMISDVTNARQATAQLRHHALHDVLTALPNRALLIDRLAMALSRQVERRDGTGVAVLALGLDGFKVVNDAHGHDVGDTILTEVAGRLTRAARAGDTVARLEGDAFVVVAEGLDPDAAVTYAQHLRASLRPPLDVGGTTLYVDASVGVAVAPTEDPTALLRSADAAMSQAKAQGRGRVHVYDSSCSGDPGRRLEVANALREALDDDGLTLGYQPIVELATGQVVGVEALLRWRHPELGLVPPPELVATAHSMGLAQPLDQAVVRRACADIADVARRTGRPDLDLSVNLSAQSIEPGTLRSMVRDAADETGWPLSQLTLEVTEGVLMADPGTAARALSDLRELEVSIALDDFGTGYSSLAYLKRFPVATLKIDRSFVETVPHDQETCAIARSIADLASALSLGTVAEGIETQEQADFMRGLGCQRGQGYLWSPAVSPDDLVALLTGWAGRDADGLTQERAAV